MIKMAKFIKALKVVVINLTICSLLQNPFISNAMAASKSSGGVDGQTILNLANGALGLYGNYLGQKQQIIQGQIAAANNQRLMSQLSPSCRKPDGTACYTAQAKFFPECQLPASMSNMPANVCASSGSQDPNAISSMLTYEAIAQGWMNYYEQMMNEASNAAYPVGLRCLEDKQKAMDTQITEMMNSLQRLQDRLNQDKQIFRDNNKKLLEDMNTANDELFGSSKNNLKIKTQDFSKFFSQSCQAVIGKDALKDGTKNGFNGILQNLSSTNKAASDFNLNKNAIENDIRRETDKIAATISSNGVGDFLEKGYIPQSDESAKTFGAISSQIQKQKAEFMTAKTRIDKVLAEVGYTAPPMDGKFSVDLQDFMAGSNEFFKKQYVNDCVTGAESGVAIPVADILGALEQKRTNSEGTARNDYRVALKVILDSDAMIADKMNQIKALEADYPGMTVTYKDATQNRVTDTPYALFMKTIAKCEQRYSQDDQFANKGNRSVSFQKKVERAKTALQELKNLNDGYASKVSQSILSQVLDCGGSPLKSGNCKEDTLNSSGEGFCISHANQCANEIQGCYAEANNHVQTRKTKMENLAKTFNANVAGMIARSNALYEQQKLAVTNITKLIQSKFPGTNFEIPKDMFVSMPEMKKDAFGVEMAGDGDLKSFLEGENSMPAKIDKLKQMFKLQKEAVAKETGDYINLQKEAMNREHGRWEEVKNRCTGTIDSVTKAIAAANAEGMKKQGEEDGRTGEFCSRYASLAENPLGVCEDASDLATDMKKVSQRLDPSVGGNVNAFRQLCNQYNNESESGTEAGSRKNKRAANKVANLKTLCVNSDGTGTKSNEDFMASLKKLSPVLKKNLSDDSVMSYILGTNSTAPKLENEDANDMVEALRADYKNGEKIENSKLLPSFKNEEIFGKMNLKKDNICSSILKSHIVSIGKDSFENLNDAASKSSDFTTENDNSITLLKELVASNAGNIEDKASELGEKLSGAPCDMQNKSSMPKNPWNSFDLKGFDQSILGSSK